jgi:uncharacterized phage-associated protein
MSFQPTQSEISAGPFDPRSICNLILDEGEQVGTPITNLALQKLLYFVHGLQLVEAKRPLVTGFFEAWRFGPVHYVAYQAFKSAGANPIQFRAEGRDPFTLSPLPVPICEDVHALQLVRRITMTYARMSAGRLVEISHAVGAPWDFTIKKAINGVALGMRIPNDVITLLFNRHKISVGPEPRHGEPIEDAPFI